MRRVLEALERYQRDIAATLGSHPLLRHADVERGHDLRRTKRQHRA